MVGNWVYLWWREGGIASSEEEMIVGICYILIEVSSLVSLEREYLQRGKRTKITR